jgi:hypothetical protein
MDLFALFSFSSVGILVLALSEGIAIVLDVGLELHARRRGIDNADRELRNFVGALLTAGSFDASSNHDIHDDESLNYLDNDEEAMM